MSTKILVTGVTGFIGRNLRSALEEAGGFELVGLVQGKGDCKGIELLECDLRQPIEELPRVDIVFHLAALVRSDEPYSSESFFKANAYGTLNLLHAMQKNSINKIIYASTMNVFGANELNVSEEHVKKPKNPYGLSKLIGEEYCRLYAENLGFKAVVLRYSGVYGKGRRDGTVYSFIKNALENKPIKIVGDGSQKWDPVWIGDVTKANLSAIGFIQKMTSSFEDFNIGYGQAISVNELAGEVSKATKTSVETVHEGVKDDLNFCFNISKARKFLGFTPTPISLSLKEFAEEVRRGD
jgi:UDP-glucose 4-epimerase